MYVNWTIIGTQFGAEETIKSTDTCSQVLPLKTLFHVPFDSLKYFLCTVVRVASSNCSANSWYNFVLVPPSHTVLGRTIYGVKSVRKALCQALWEWSPWRWYIIITIWNKNTVDFPHMSLPWNPNENNFDCHAIHTRVLLFCTQCSWHAKWTQQTTHVAHNAIIKMERAWKKEMIFMNITWNYYFSMKIVIYVHKIMCT